MTSNRFTLVLLLLVLPLATAAAPLRVMVSVVPLRTVVERIGGDLVDVEVMVTPGHNPHTFDPTPRQVTSLARADLYVGAGIPFESAWMERIRSTNPRMQVLDVRDGMGPLPADRGGPPGGVANAAGHGHAHDLDAHIWTDPLAVKQMAGRIRDTLARLDPAGGGVYHHNHDAFAAELEALDEEIRGLLERAPSRSFLVYHPAWGHFAARYGLIQVAIEKDGKEPGARTLTRLINEARRDGIEVVFVQPQFDTRLAARVADAIGGRVVVLDPLAADYIANLRRAARLIAGADAP